MKSLNRVRAYLGRFLGLALFVSLVVSLAACQGAEGVYAKGKTPPPPAAKGPQANNSASPVPKTSPGVAAPTTAPDKASGTGQPPAEKTTPPPTSAAPAPAPQTNSPAAAPQPSEPSAAAPDQVQEPPPDEAEGDEGALVGVIIELGVDTITLKEGDGFETTIMVAGTTTVEKVDGSAGKLSELKKGMMVMAFFKPMSEVASRIQIL